MDGGQSRLDSLELLSLRFPALHLPSKAAVEPIKVRVSQRDPAASPHVEGVRSVVLKEGPRARRIAKLTRIRNSETGEHHHDSLSIKTYALNDESCTFDPKRSVTMNGAETDKFLGFLDASRSGAVPVETGGFIVARSGSRTAEILQSLKSLKEPDRLDALATLLRQISEKPELFNNLVDRLANDEGYVEKAAAALNLAVSRRVVAELQRLIEDPGSKEGSFQNLLTEHPWLFGSGYSQLLDRRRWTRDAVADFFPLRTTDGCGELIEIKTPLNGKSLFSYDPSHKTWFPGSELSKAVAQVKKYLEDLDRERDAILAKDHVDVTKIYAKIIIGRDGDSDQQAALRRENAHTTRIEIITYDGLLKIAKRVLSCIERPLSEAVSSDAPSQAQ